MKKILIDLGSLLTGLALLNAAIFFAPTSRESDNYSFKIAQFDSIEKRTIIQDTFKKKLLVLMAISGVGVSVVGGLGEKFKN
ncbi:MAG: hypothetical protein QNJ38_11780 [Prochloraceae cyanobacterium]|nr:hypothetical protein [Prochloraceae cyanobacterium]